MDVEKYRGNVVHDEAYGPHGILRQATFCKPVRILNLIAVTGAAGFIGSNLARHLCGLGRHQLLLVDRPLTLSRESNLEGLTEFPFVEHLAFLELLDRDDCAVEAIFHLGACSDTTESDWDFLWRNNVEYSQRLWQWCARREVPFIYASSAATYGDGSRGFDDQTPPEDLLPLNLYGRSKIEFDRWVLDRQSAGERAPRGWAGLKFFNVYGPQEQHKGRMASMVWHSYRQIVTEGEVRLFKSNDPDYPDGGQLRDFVSVDGCVDQMIWLWKNSHVCGIFNSGTGRARSFLDLVSATFRALNLNRESRSSRCRTTCRADTRTTPGRRWVSSAPRATQGSPLRWKRGCHGT